MTQSITETLLCKRKCINDKASLRHTIMKTKKMHSLKTSLTRLCKKETCIYDTGLH